MFQLQNGQTSKSITVYVSSRRGISRLNPPKTACRLVSAVETYKELRRASNPGERHFWPSTPLLFLGATKGIKQISVVDRSNMGKDSIFKLMDDRPKKYKHFLIERLFENSFNFRMV